ncbi:MAG: DNA polymerase III subunit gamma/tau, partial [Bacteroidia bacterium]
MNPNFVDMQGYQVSARKYRPPRFDELVGQEHITTTLLNAIAKGQLAQAYLFCGPRGVGKTSCARIFAKTINCSNRDSSGEACGSCPTCLSFDQGGSLSIHELDAASNNSVDDIRSLVEQVRYPPQGSAFKVYIVDEVHMLSTSAFNALLKTLEEPPSYAKFILATTEKHKILPTILSRCQIFDFKRIRPQDIADRLALVCKAEQITYDAEALLTIAGRSDGALRDALTMLDQLAGYGGGHLGQTLVAEQLGVLNQQGFLDATETLQKGDPGPTLQILGTLIARGYDPIQWVLGMAVHLRNLLMAKAPGTLDLVESGPEFKEKLHQQALRSDTGFLLGALHLLNQVELQYRQARQPRLLVETALFKIGYLANRQQQTTGSSQTTS